jgi:hypothetical protein
MQNGKVLLHHQQLIVISHNAAGFKQLVNMLHGSAGEGQVATYIAAGLACKHFVTMLQGSTGGGQIVLPHVPLLQVPVQLAGRPAKHAVPSGNRDSSHFPAYQEQHRGRTC